MREPVHWRRRMKYRTAELEGELLDQAVAMCVGLTALRPCFSTDWKFGGALIERSHICLEERRSIDDVALRRSTWLAYTYDDPQRLISLGRTPLVAAMRLYVAQTLGPEVELP